MVGTRIHNMVAHSQFTYLPGAPHTFTHPDLTHPGLTYPDSKDLAHPDPIYP